MGLVKKDTNGKTVARFLQDVRADSRPPPLKIALAGHGAAGKTTLKRQVMLGETPLSTDVANWGPPHRRSWLSQKNFHSSVINALSDSNELWRVLQSPNREGELCIAWRGATLELVLGRLEDRADQRAA